MLSSKTEYAHTQTLGTTDVMGGCAFIHGTVCRRTHTHTPRHGQISKCNPSAHPNLQTRLEMHRFSNERQAPDRRSANHPDRTHVHAHLYPIPATHLEIFRFLRERHAHTFIHRPALGFSGFCADVMHRPEHLARPSHTPRNSYRPWRTPCIHLKTHCSTDSHLDMLRFMVDPRVDANATLHTHSHLSTHSRSTNTMTPTNTISQQPAPHCLPQCPIASRDKIFLAQESGTRAKLVQCPCAAYGRRWRMYEGDEKGRKE